MWALRVLVLIGAVFTKTLSTLNSIDLTNSISCTDRQLEGLFCQNCDILSTCVQMSNEWLTIPVKACDTSNGYYCNMFYGGCSNNTGSCNPVGHEINFMCNTEGIFPDPYDCQRYHLCFRPDGTNLVAINLSCTGNTAFSVQTNECTTYINSTICAEKQFQCARVGDQNPWPGNTNIFYICASTRINGQDVLFPLMFRCPSSQIHDGNRCVLNSGDGQTTTTTEVQTTTVDGPTEFQCPTFGLFPHPNNCTMYYICNQALIASLVTCPAGSYFHRDSSSCRLGVC